MPSTHTSLHYHLIFATKHREPTLAKEWRNELHSYLGGVVNGLDASSEGVGGVADHVHLLVSLKPTACLSDFMRELKKASSSWIRESKGSGLPLAGRLRGLHRQRLRTGFRPHLHCQPGGAPSREILPRGVDRVSWKNPASPTIRATSIDPRHRCWHPAGMRIVLHSLIRWCRSCPRSTTGYRLRSLRDHPGVLHPDHFVDLNKMVRSASRDAGSISCASSFTDAEGIPSCSRWLNPLQRVTPPDPRVPGSRTPAGVPAPTNPNTLE